MLCCVPLPSAANLSLKVLFHHRSSAEFAWSVQYSFYNTYQTTSSHSITELLIARVGRFIEVMASVSVPARKFFSSASQWKRFVLAISYRTRLFQRGSVHLRDSNSLHVCHLYSKIFSENMLFLESHFCSTSDTHSFTPFLRSTSCQNTELLHSYFNLYGTLTWVSKYM